MISVLPLRFARITGTSPQNSQINWRQAPHGGVRTSVSVTTEMASKPRSPSLMALKMAMRSAQMVRPYVAFSTLQPPKILPEVARSAAPTRKLEYGACAFSLACFAAEIRVSFSLTSGPPGTPHNSNLCDGLCDSWNDGFQQADELSLDAIGCLQHFEVVERLVQNSGRRVRHTGDAQDADATVARGNHFWNCGHADEIGTDGAQIAYLRRRFVTWAEESRIHTFIHPNAHAVRFTDRHFTEAFVVSRGHVVKAQAKALVVWPGERIDALQIDVVADHHQSALREFAFDATRCIGENHGLHSHARENTDGKGHFFCGITFIKMDAALHAGDRDC